MAARSMYPVLDSLYKGRFEEYLTKARGKGQSYETIAAEVEADHGFEISYRSIARWCEELGIEKASA